MPPPPTPRGFARGFWSFINVVSLFGCVGGALATLLGLVPAAYATYAMCLPLVLPIVSLAATMARERVVSEVRVPPAQLPTSCLAPHSAHA